MKRLKSSGQEAIEFVLISALIFMAALGTILIFGNKLAAFFSGGSSSVVAASNQEAPTVDAVNDKQYKANYETELGYETVKVGGQEFIVKEDGTVVFNVGGQTVNLAPSAMNYINTTMQTSGISGSQEVVKAITKIITEEKVKYPDSEVPIEMAFGQSKIALEVVDEYPDSGYIETEEVNSASLKSGNRIIIINKEKGCVGSRSYDGTYIIDGTYDPTIKKYLGNVSSVDVDGSPKGKLEATFDLNEGLIFINAKYSQKDVKDPIVYYWSMDFSDSNKQFDIIEEK